MLGKSCLGIVFIKGGPWVKRLDKASPFSPLKGQGCWHFCASKNLEDLGGHTSLLSERTPTSRLIFISITIVCGGHH
jgi:hypothetical protein